MSNVYFISDLHLGHKNILKFSPNRMGATVDEHDQWVLDIINLKVLKRDILYILGDIAFTPEALAKFGCGVNGQVKLILGNHDKFPITDYGKYFTILPGLVAYKGFWLSHAPIHPDELRGRKNIHGHVHDQSIDDQNYINVCVEKCLDGPIPWQDILIQK